MPRLDLEPLLEVLKLTMEVQIAHHWCLFHRYSRGALEGGLECLRRHSRGLERGSPWLEVIEHLTEAGWRSEKEQLIIRHSWVSISIAEK